MACFDLKLGFNCNNNCRHCVITEKKKAGSLTFEQVLQILNDRPKDVDVIQVTGGEPTTYEYLPDVLKYIRQDLGLGIVMQTNGTGFANPEFFKKCQPYLDHVHIAIHSCIPEIHDFIVQSPGMWEKTILGFQNLISDPNIYVTTQTVLSRYNILTVYDTFDFIQKMAPGTQMSFTYPHMMGNAWRNRKEVCFRYSEYYLEIQRILARFHELMFVESIPPCYLHPYTDVMYNSTEGDILYHTIDRIGVDFSDGIDQVKNYNILDAEDRRKGPKCKECIYNKKCVGVWKEYFDLFKDQLDLYPITQE